MLARSARDQPGLPRLFPAPPVRPWGIDPGASSPGSPGLLEPPI
jgi:hypothetical protein